MPHLLGTIFEKQLPYKGLLHTTVEKYYSSKIFDSFRICSEVICLASLFFIILPPWICTSVICSATSIVDKVLLSTSCAICLSSAVLLGMNLNLGNHLLSVNERKLTGVYWSIADFGSRVLQNEEAWFELFLIKSTTVRKLDGGFAGLSVAATKSTFCVN